MADSTCFLCLEGKQTGAVIAGLLLEILQQLDPMASTDVADIIDEAKCFLCLDDRQLLAVQASLLDQINTAGGLVAGCCVTTSTVDPVADPGVQSQLWINRLTGGVWYWDDGNGVWQALIV